MRVQRMGVAGAVSLAISLLAVPAFADFADCSVLPSYSALRAALVAAVVESTPFQMRRASEK